MPGRQRPQQREETSFAISAHDKFSTVIARLAEAWAVAGGVVLLLIMAVTSLNTIGFAADRLAQIVGVRVSGLPGYEDFVTLAVAVAALTFLPYCQAQRGHVQVDLLGRLLSPSWRFALDWVWTATAFALSLFLAVWLFYGMLETRADRVLSPVLAWPVWLFYLPGIISLALWALVSASQLSVARDGR